ncbi:unnamed protein product, partial [Phyllotreta striolata]
DLIRNYKLIIKEKNQQSDSDSERQSSTSSPDLYSSDCGEPMIFEQEICFSDSECDIENSQNRTSNKQKRQNKLENARKKQLSYNSITMKNDDYLFEKLDQSLLNEVVSENSKLLSTRLIKNNSQSSFINFETTDSPKNSSLVTIFAIWNTTVGSSLLAMAWGMGKAGLFPGIVINLIVMTICLYTAYVLLKVKEKHGPIGENFEVPELCRLLIGRWAEQVSKVFSLVILIGSDIVYYILMSNFLYNFVVFIYGYFNEVGNHNPNADTVQCPKEILVVNKTHLVQSVVPSTPFYTIWNLYSTVPLILAVIMFPLLNMKSPTFFTKFNSLGIVSISYLIIFVAVKSFVWGVHLDDWSGEFHIKSTFCVLSGTLTMSYFIHNIIVSIMMQNKHQKSNGRDLTIAFILVSFTYLFLGAAFYIAFPLKKTCIEDNLLNNFSKQDVMALIARVLLFFQLFTVFPFVTYMLRGEIMSCIKLIFGKERHGEFSYTKTIIININIVFICLMFACFLPKIGTLIRYTGALSGLIYVFVMPSLLKMASLRKENSLTFTKGFLHVGLIILGALNLISQFFME